MFSGASAARLHGKRLETAHSLSRMRQVAVDWNLMYVEQQMHQSGSMKHGLRSTCGDCCALQALRRQLPGRPPPSEQPRSLSLGAVLQDSAGAITCGGIAGMAMWALVRACMRQAAGDMGACWMHHSTNVQLWNLVARPYLVQVLPIDVAKSRLQVARPGSQCDISLLQNLWLLHKERACLDAPLRSMPHIVKAHVSAVLMSNVLSPFVGGFRGLYTGLSLVQTRAFPANAAQW